MILEMIFGIFLFLFYPIAKMVRSLHSDGWDRSNATNYIRTESYTAMYAENLPLMTILTDEQKEVLFDAGFNDDDLLYPFKYVSGDEFSDHFPYTRIKDE